MSSLGEKVKKASIYQGIAVFRHTFFYTDNCQEEIGLHCTGAASAFPYRPPSWCPVLVARSFVFCVVFCRSLFVLFLMAIVLSVLRFMDSDYPFGIFKLFLLVKFTRYLLLVNSYHCMYFQYCSGKNHNELLPFVYHPLFTFHNFDMSEINELQFKPNLSVKIMYIEHSLFVYLSAHWTFYFVYHLHV